MEESTDCCDIDIMPIPFMDIERKTLPVICPQCKKITGIAEIDVSRDMMISPLYRMSGKFRHLFSKWQNRPLDPIYPVMFFDAIMVKSRENGKTENDAMRAEKGKVTFMSNNAGGITGGLATGQPIVARVAVKPTPTIDKKQVTIDKYTLKNTDLAAITRRDPTIAGRIWPVAENYMAIVLLDYLIAHYGYQTLKDKISAKR